MLEIYSLYFIVLYMFVVFDCVDIGVGRSESCGGSIKKRLTNKYSQEINEHIRKPNATQI